ncbi:Hypothetical predicted protein [Octopus vulgaris]|uniref:Uncharacterized protein n=2 Tax=Octopus vulgaris TaxID=6645 RepID=A0AA36F425_OCTVU|nr:Hypothetical predicted protein [Octopus vulgaris]
MDKLDEDKPVSQNGNAQNEEEEEKQKHEQQEALRKWKKKIITIVCTGNIDGLEDIMDEPEFDINITWFQENLLMQAIRAEQMEMAEFLIDNGINYNFSKMVLDYNEKSRIVDCYTVNCRQLAYEHSLFKTVQLIDLKNQEAFDFISSRNRLTSAYMSKRRSEKSFELETSEIYKKTKKNIGIVGVKKRKDLASNILAETYKFRLHSLPSRFTLSLKGNNFEILFIQGKCKYGHTMGERCSSANDIYNHPYMLLRHEPQKYKNCLFLLTKQPTFPKLKNYKRVE